MTPERKPVAFGDMRNWMKALKSAGELREIDAEVDWNVELGTITRIAQGPGTGPALLFNNIKDYNKSNSRCRRIFGSALNSYRRIAMMLGLPPDTHPRELVKLGKRDTFGKQVGAAVGVSQCVPEPLPRAVGEADLEGHGQIRNRRATRGVEHVRGDGAHRPSRHFSRRRRVI